MNLKLKLLLSLLVTTTCGNAVAELNDPPYFNLWQTGVIAGKSQEAGDGAMKTVCGTYACTQGTDPHGLATFMVVDPNSGTGSGAIDPFLRFQHNVGAPGNNTTEQAYSTNFEQNSQPKAGWLEDGDTGDISRNQAKDSNAGNPDFNRALWLDDLLANADSDGNLHFLLDINEPISAAGTTTLRLDELAFFVDNSGTLNYLTDDMAGFDYNAATADDPNYDPNNPADPTRTLATASLCRDNGQNGSNFGADLTDCAEKVWDMDFDKVLADGVGGLNLNNVNNAPNGGGGSGDYDVKLKLHSSLFLNEDGSKKGDWVYLYNFMGEADEGANEAEAGFEEWAFLQSDPGTPGVPEPSIAFLLAAAVPATIRGIRRKQK